MARPKGTKSEDYDARRSEILQRLSKRLTQPDAMQASFRDLVAASGVSISTIQHYFGRREDVIAAILKDAREKAAPHFAHLREPSGPFEQSIKDVVAYLRLGFEKFGVGDLHALGFVEGIRNGRIGPLVVECVLEPSIEAIAARLCEHQVRGEMNRWTDPRFAALMLIAPPIFLLMHQRELEGAKTHPADLDAFFEQHAKSFVAAHRMQGEPVGNSLESRRTNLGD